MPKKPKINKRLDDLFKDVKPEEHAKGKATKPKVQKDAPPRLQRTPSLLLQPNLLPSR